MASFVSAAKKTVIQSKMDQLFDTFVDEEQGGSTITVHKEPKKSYSSVSQRSYVGYGPSSTPSNVTYTPVSETFSAIVTYDKKQANQVLSEVGLSLENGEVMIEVEANCKNYIENGVKNEKIVIDSRSFQITSEPIEDKFFGSLRYLYKIKEIR